MIFDKNNLNCNIYILEYVVSIYQNKNEFRRKSSKDRRNIRTNK
jgi:hypothetical protein